VIDGNTGTLTKTISISNIKPDTSSYERIRGYIAINPVTDLLSVASSYSNLLDIFDPETGNLISNVTLVGHPSGISTLYKLTSVMSSNPNSSDKRYNSGNLTTMDNFASSVLVNPIDMHPTGMDVSAAGHAYVIGYNQSKIVYGSGVPVHSNGSSILSVYDRTQGYLFRDTSRYTGNLIRNYTIGSSLDPGGGVDDTYIDVAINNGTYENNGTAYILSEGDALTFPHIIKLDLTSGNKTIEHLGLEP